jgi:hypothetical protein
MMVIPVQEQSLIKVLSPQKTLRRLPYLSLLHFSVVIFFCSHLTCECCRNCECHHYFATQIAPSILPPKTPRIIAFWYLTQSTYPRGPPSPAMDIVLEIVDTFIFDPLYAQLLPGASPPPSFGANATYSSFKAEPTSYAVPHATWQYEPSTHYFSLQPSQYAYMSALARDDWRRQASTLFLITWYALPNGMSTYST